MRVDSKGKDAQYVGDCQKSHLRKEERKEGRKEERCFDSKAKGINRKEGRRNSYPDWETVQAGTDFKKKTLKKKKKKKKMLKKVLFYFFKFFFPFFFFFLFRICIVGDCEPSRNSKHTKSPAKPRPPSLFPFSPFTFTLHTPPPLLPPHTTTTTTPPSFTFNIFFFFFFFFLFFFFLFDYSVPLSLSKVRYLTRSNPIPFSIPFPSLPIFPPPICSCEVLLVKVLFF